MMALVSNCRPSWIAVLDGVATNFFGILLINLHASQEVENYLLNGHMICQGKMCKGH